MSIAAFLMGGADEEGFYLYGIEPAGSVVRQADYMADGSGMVFALGVLESEYKPNMSMREGIELAKKAINASIQRDTSSGNGIDIWTINEDGIKEEYAQAVNIGLF